LLADGRVLIAGGTPGGSTQSPAEIYDPQSGAYTATGNLIDASACTLDLVANVMPVLSTCSATLLPNGKVLFVGISAEIYDVASGTFTLTMGAMIIGRSAADAALLPNGTVLIAGGMSEGLGVFYSGGDMPVPTGERIDAFQTEIYDPVVDSFSAGPVIFARYGSSATTLADGSVLLAGGGPMAAQIYP
jgi:hypothetical protein